MFQHGGFTSGLRTNYCDLRQINRLLSNRTKYIL